MKPWPVFPPRALAITLAYPSKDIFGSYVASLSHFNTNLLVKYVLSNDMILYNIKRPAIKLAFLICFEIIDIN